MIVIAEISDTPGIDAAPRAARKPHQRIGITSGRSRKNIDADNAEQWENTKGKHTRKLRHIPPLAGGAKRPHPNAKHQDCCLLGMKLRSEKVRRVFYPAKVILWFRAHLTHMTHISHSAHVADLLQHCNIDNIDWTAATAHCGFTSLRHVRQRALRLHSA